MAKKMNIITLCAIALSIISGAAYGFRRSEALLALTITFATITYHFAMRLIVGTVYQRVMHNRADLSKRRYRVGDREMALYKRLKVKRWKGKLPTYAPDTFDPHAHSFDEIAQATCQAERVHETIIALSFLPVAASIWLGALPVFVITSVLAALIDLPFVMIQRFNRARILKVCDKSR